MYRLRVIYHSRNLHPLNREVQIQRSWICIIREACTNSLSIYEERMGGQVHEEGLLGNLLAKS